MSPNKPNWIGLEHNKKQIKALVFEKEVELIYLATEIFFEIKEKD